MSYKMKSKGFTLIELMIVIAIIGILAAVAVPQYGQYNKRAKFSEIVTYTTPYKRSVDECILINNSASECNGGQNSVLDDSTNVTSLISSISTSAGTVTVNTAQEVDNHTYILEPQFDPSTSTLDWNQTGSCLAVGLC